MITYKFKIQNKVPEKARSELSDLQKSALKQVAQLLEDFQVNEDSDEQLHNKFYDICRDLGLDTQDFFTGAYQVLINKEKGPQLASFILTIGIEKVRELFMNV
jgi:lysyl-tRNA synthetase class 1